MQFANKMHTHTHYNDEKNKIKNTNLLVCVACKISNYTKNLEESTETCQYQRVHCTTIRELDIYNHIQFELYTENG